MDRVQWKSYPQTSLFSAYSDAADDCSRRTRVMGLTRIGGPESLRATRRAIEVATGRRRQAIAH